MGDDTLIFPRAEAERLEPRLPPRHVDQAGGPVSAPFVTLTFATSLDSALSLGPGIRTALSGPESKAMTHYLRSRHDAICVGAGTAIADDPGLNCRIEADEADEHAHPAVDSARRAITSRQPRPIIIDPSLRWDFKASSKVLQLARAGKGLAPYVLTAVSEPPADKTKLLEEHGGKFIALTPGGVDGAGRSTAGRFDWSTIMNVVRDEGLKSIMIEGGGEVINSLLSPGNTTLIDSIIVTLAPTWLGQGSVRVCPSRRVQGSDVETLAAPVRLADTTWIPLGEDVVLSGRVAR